MRTASDLRRVMHDIGRIYELLPAIVDIQSGVPHVVDAIDDDELAAFKSELFGRDEAMTWVEQARTTIATAPTRYTRGPPNTNAFRTRGRSNYRPSGRLRGVALCTTLGRHEP